MIICNLILKNNSLFFIRNKRHYSVLKNIVEPQCILLKRSKKEATENAMKLLKKVGLEEKASAYPCELSGGQQQRATIGRAIANHPKVLIADEPTGNLDPEKSIEIIQLLDKINQVEKTTIVMVTHDEKLVNAYKKRTIALEEGFIVADIKKGGYIQHD